MYNCANVDSVKLVALPIAASSHIQDTASESLAVIAAATPATLLVPAHEAAEIVKALKVEVPPTPPETPGGFSVVALSISGMHRSYTIMARQRKYKPVPTGRVVMDSQYLSFQIFTQLVACSMKLIREF